MKGNVKTAMSWSPKVTQIEIGLRLKDLRLQLLQSADWDLGNIPKQTLGQAWLVLYSCHSGRPFSAASKTANLHVEAAGVGQLVDGMSRYF
jgi:hypothetical protein